MKTKNIKIACGVRQCGGISLSYVMELFPRCVSFWKFTRSYQKQANYIVYYYADYIVLMVSNKTEVRETFIRLVERKLGCQQTRITLSTRGF